MLESWLRRVSRFEPSWKLFFRMQVLTILTKDKEITWSKSLACWIVDGSMWALRLLCFWFAVRSLLKGRRTPDNPWTRLRFIALGADGTKDEPTEKDETGETNNVQADTTIDTATWCFGNIIVGEWGEAESRSFCKRGRFGANLRLTNLPLFLFANDHSQGTYWSVSWFFLSVRVLATCLFFGWV